MTTKTTYKKMITTILLITATLLIQSCNKPTEPSESKIEDWQKIAELEGVDVFDVKIHNNEIYIAGRDAHGKGVILKSKDAMKWGIINSSIADTFSQGVMAIDFLKGDLIAAYSTKPVYLIKPQSITPITKPILMDLCEMVVDNKSNILIGTTYSASYSMKYIIQDSIIDIYDSLYTFVGCEKQSAIVPIGVTKLLKDSASDGILIGNFNSNHYVTLFKDMSINCFPTEGLSFNDKKYGCHDIMFINDTLFATSDGVVKFLDNSFWKIYGDSIPKTILGHTPMVTAITNDPNKNEIYIATQFLGVLKWDTSNGWVPFNKGIASSDGYYDTITEIIYFNNHLIITYGSYKQYYSYSRGIMVYSLN